MDAREQFAAKILDAIRSGGDVWVHDRYIPPNDFERARQVLIETRDACPDPDESAFLTSMIRALEERATT